MCGRGEVQPAVRGIERHHVEAGARVLDQVDVIANGCLRCQSAANFGKLGLAGVPHPRGRDLGRGPKGLCDAGLHTGLGGIQLKSSARSLSTLR